MRTKREESAMATPWWKVDTNVHEAVWAQAQKLFDDLSPLRMDYLDFLSAYTNRAVTSFSGLDFLLASNNKERTRVNALRSAADTAASAIGTAQPKPQVITVKGDKKKRLRAEKLNRFIMGLFFSLKQYTEEQLTFLYALVCGDGYQLITNDGKEITNEPVPPWEILFEPQRRKQRAIIRYKTMPRSEAMELFPDDSFEDVCGSVMNDSELDEDADETQLCTILYAWYPPIRRGAKGRHVVCSSNATLVDEVWKDPIPLARFAWSNPIIGYIGQGLIEEGLPIQWELNSTVQKVQRLMTLATSMIFVDRMANVARITNKDWARYEYSNKPPLFQNVSSISPEYFLHGDRCERLIYALAGVSQLAAQSKKPAGLDSGEAVRAFNDVSSRRFMHTSQRWDQYHVDCAFLMLLAARRIGSMKVVAHGDKFIESLSLADCDLRNDEFAFRIRPAGLLPEEPAGRIAAIQALAGAIPSAQPFALELVALDPDLESFVDRILANRRLAEKMVSSILEEGYYISPHPAMDPIETRKIATDALLEAIHDKDEEADSEMDERIEMLMDFCAECDVMVKKAMMAEMAQGGPVLPMSGGPPPAGGMLAPPPMPGGQPGGMPAPQPQPAPV